METNDAVGMRSLQTRFRDGDRVTYWRLNPTMQIPAVVRWKTPKRITIEIANAGSYGYASDIVLIAVDSCALRDRT